MYENECCVSNCAAKTGNTTVDISERMVCLLKFRKSKMCNKKLPSRVYAVLCVHHIYIHSFVFRSTLTHTQNRRAKHPSMLHDSFEMLMVHAFVLYITHIYARICFSTTGFYVSAACMKFFYFTLNKQLQKFIQPNFVRSIECMKDYNCLRTMQQPNDNNIHIWHVYIRVTRVLVDLGHLCF